MSSVLKIRAEDAEDIGIVSSCLQDSIVPVKDIGFFPDEKRFVMVANRFKWETPVSPSLYERTLCAVRAEGVTNVTYQHIDRSNPEFLLDVLSFRLQDQNLYIDFAGGGALCLALQKGWHILVNDIGQPWPTHQCPTHHPPS